MYVLFDLASALYILMRQEKKWMKEGAAATMKKIVESMHFLLCLLLLPANHFCSYESMNCSQVQNGYSTN